MDYKIVLDIIVAILLAATIAYAVVLNKRIGQLRSNRDDLAKLIAAFNEATQRAEAGIQRLKRTAEEAGGSLQERVEKAQSLRDDLAFMTERADAMANRLENAVRSSKSDGKPAASMASPAPRPQSPRRSKASPTIGADAIDADDRSEAERELLRALQSVR